MHTQTIGLTVFNHDGGYDGYTRITDENGNICEIPFDDIKEFVAAFIRQEKISRLENTHADNILGL